MLARSGKQHETPSVADVLHVCEPGGLASGSRRLSNAEPILRDQLLIDGAGIFSLWYLARDVEPIAVAHVGHGYLLNEPGNARCFATIFHRSLRTERKNELREGLFSGQSLKA